MGYGFTTLQFKHAPCRRGRVAHRLVIVEALRKAGFEVVEASTAHEALTIIEGDTFIHLVFADGRMPGTMDGIALMSLRREIRPELKLAVASGYSPDWPSPRVELARDPLVSFDSGSP